MKTLPSTAGAPPSPRGRTIRWLRLSAATGLVAGLSFFMVLPAFASTESGRRVTFGIAPASATGLNGRPNFSFGVTPGAFLDSYAAVLNYSSVPLTLQVYATDAIETSDGGIGLLPANVRPTGAGAWISLPRSFSTVRVPAESAKAPGQIVIPFVVRVPDKATPGDHVGGVVVSLRTVGTNASGQNVVLLQRVGARVFIQVAGKLLPKLAVTDLRTSYQGTLNPVGEGKATVSYLLRNTGNVDLAVGAQSASVSGLLGSQRHVALAKVALLLAGASLFERAVVSGVWPQLLLHTSVSARPLPLAGGSGRGLVSVTAGTWTWAVPWPLFVVVVLLLLAAVVALRVRAKARARARKAARAPGRRPQVVNA